MSTEEPQILWDHREENDTFSGKGVATFRGPGGFTQQIMARNMANGIAEALGISFVECVPGTLTPKE